MATKLPAKYAYLNDASTMPAIVVEAVKLYGTLEKKGAGSNPEIVKWADEVEDGVGSPYSKWAADWYNDDGIAWCGLFMAVIAVRSNPRKLPTRMPPVKYLSALEWQHFGIAAKMADVIVGDILVKSRDGGGHVTLCVGVTKVKGKITKVHCLGGNQGDAVNIVEYDPAVFSYVRRIPYSVAPAGAKQIEVGAGAASSPVKEA